MTSSKGRLIDIRRITSEGRILQASVEAGLELNTAVPRVNGKATFTNDLGEEVLGVFRTPTASKAAIADMELLETIIERKLSIPSFLEAGPRKELSYDPARVRVAIVTVGGLAPGIHCVIHGLVKRHCNTYSMDQAHGKIFGVYDSFRGLSDFADNFVELDPSITEEWLDHGGSSLGNVRYYLEAEGGRDALNKMVGIISKNLQDNDIDILYVIGGDGSLRVAHEIARRNKDRSVVGIPKTMDNDILWISQSFGFDTAVEQAANIINVLHSEARSTRRICLIELFGAESGFVAANAALASGHANQVLIPEVFNSLNRREAEEYLKNSVEYIQQSVQAEPRNPHAVIVVAEGVGTVLEKKGVIIDGVKIRKDGFTAWLKGMLEETVRDSHGRPMQAFLNQPRHHIRAVPANAHDQIYCEQLSAMAVDAALAGYTDFMISHWLNEYVLVPLELVRSGQKSIPVHSMFWKQVVNSTGQPLSAAEKGDGD